MQKKIYSFILLLCVMCVFGAETLPAVQDMDSLPVKVVLFPFREAVLSTQIEGVIIRQPFRQGERFKKGDELVKLDDSKYKNDLLRAESSVREAALNAAYTEQKFKDNQRLYKDGLQSDIELQKSKFDAELAKERFGTAQTARLDAIRNLSFCIVKAPFDGTVEKLLARDFENVRNSQPILGIIDDNQLLAVMNLPSRQLMKIRRGQKISMQIHETGKTVSGTVFEIAGRADHRSETFEIKVLIDNKEHALKAGMSGILLRIGE